MRAIRTFTAFAVIGAVATPALSQDSTEGFYAFIGLSATGNALGQRSESSSSGTTFTSSNITSTRQSGMGVQGGVGYRFTRNSAVEVIALRLPDSTETWSNTFTDLATGTVTTNTNTNNVTNSSLAVTWVYGVPVNQWVNPFARAGVTLNYAKSRSTGTGTGSTSSGSSTGFSTGYLVGLGNDFYFTPERNTALRTELMLQSNTSSFNSGSASLATSVVFKF